MTPRRILVASSLLGIAAVIATVEPAEASCSKIDCGTNSPIMETYEFYEGEETGNEYNAQGLRFPGILIPGDPVLYQMDVEEDRLRAVDGFGNVVYQGAQLTGAQIRVETDTMPTQQFTIFIENVHDNSKFWVDPGRDVIETYELTYTGPHTTQHTKLCPDTPGAPTWEMVVEDHVIEEYVNPLEAIFYTGDRYDAPAKTVTASSYAEARTWFNIGCAGNVLYKLHKTRNTTAGSDSAHQTTAAQRQAMLKMYVSDVCGNGDSFTHPNVPLHWNNPLGWGFLEPTDTMEALWNESGALCLTEHRLGTEFETAIETCWDGDPAPPHVPPPACEDVYPDYETTWPTNAYVISKIPQL